MKSLMGMPKCSFFGRSMNAAQKQHRRRRQPIGKKTDPLGSVKVTCSALNVRSGIGTKTTRIGGLIKGQTAVYYEEKDGWLRIQYGAQTGWICAEYTTFDASQVKPENPEPKPEEPKPEEPEEPKPELTPYQKLLKEHPEVITNQDLINLFFKMGGGDIGGAAKAAAEYGVDLNALANDRNGKVDRGEPDIVSGSAEIAKYLRSSFPNGITAMFVLEAGADGGTEFINRANRIKEKYPTVGIKDGKLEKNVFGTIRQGGNGSAISSQVVSIVSSVKKCLADNPDPNSVVDDAKVAKIDNLPCLCHGSTTGTDALSMAQISNFALAIKPYISDSFRVQFYSCSCARNENSKPSWGERGWRDSNIPEESQCAFNKNNMGKGSFCDQLAKALGPDASVYGHSTRGHTTENYCAHVFGKDADHAVNGRHMFDIFFPQSFVAEQAANRNKSEVSVRSSMFSYYCNAMEDHWGNESFINPEGTGEKMRSGWLSQN